MAVDSAALAPAPFATGGGHRDLPRGQVRTLLWLYFGAAFSYAHLPLALVHHSLGSLFNYVGAMLVAVALLNLLRLRFVRTEIAALVGLFAILVAALVGQAIGAVLTGFNTLGPELLLRCIAAVFSTLIPLAAVLLIVVLANQADFRFTHVARATRFAIYVLCAYLLIETLGSRLQLEPFSTVVDLSSQYLNYRDDADLLGGRVRGFSNEPSYLAVVVVFMVTVVLVDGTLSAAKRYGLLLLLLALSSTSLSKNVLGGVALLLVLHALYFRRLIPIMAIAMTMFGGLFYLSLAQNEGILWQYEEFGVDFSTLTRVGSWVAAWHGFVEHPVFGNGLGMAGKLIVQHYPDWFYLSPEAAKWEADAEKFAAPVFSNLFRVLFELGMFGVALLVHLVRSLVRMSNERRFTSHDNALFIAGFLVCYGMVDVLTFWPWFVALGIRRPAQEVR